MPIFQLFSAKNAYFSFDLQNISPRLVGMLDEGGPVSQPLRLGVEAENEAAYIETNETL